jgi:hypothetical protein
VSSPEGDLAEASRTLFRKARGDAAAARDLAANPDIPDEIIDFHAQQAVEKWPPVTSCPIDMTMKDVLRIDAELLVSEGLDPEWTGFEQKVRLRGLRLIPLGHTVRWPAPAPPTSAPGDTLKPAAT